MAALPKSGGDDNESKIEKVTKQEMKNPVIGMMGISDYNGEMTTLPGILDEYKNIRHVFHKIRGYSIAFMTQDNKIEMQNEYKKLANNDPLLNYKINWTKEEIIEYNKQLVEKITDYNNTKKKNKFDGIMYFISCHGDSEGVIYDSKCESVDIKSTFFELFNNKNCESLYGKPKIFFLDCCRGNLTSRKTTTTNTTNNNNNDRKENTDNNNTTANNANERNLNEQVLSGLVLSSVQKSILHEESDFRIYFANTEAYATIDGAHKGGYLIRSIVKVLNEQKSLETRRDFDELMIKVRKSVYVDTGKKTGQVMEAINYSQYKLLITPNIKNMHLKTKDDSLYISSVKSSEVAAIKLLNPLIVMFAIEDYANNKAGIKLEDMPSAKYDYFEVMEKMNFKCGYSHVCMVNNKNIDKGWEISHNIAKVCDKSKVMQNFKTSITWDDIFDFNEYIAENILTNENKYNYDGLIYFISGLGKKDSIIYDSAGEDNSLTFILDVFSNKKCQCLTNKPKIFIIDTSRGADVSTGTSKQKTKLKNNNNNDDNNIFLNNNNNNIVSENEEKENKLKDKKKNKADDNENKAKQELRKIESIDASEHALKRDYYLEHSDIRIIYATPDGYKKMIMTSSNDKKK